MSHAQFASFSDGTAWLLQCSSLRIDAADLFGRRKMPRQENNGLYITGETEDDLIAAFKKTLDCPMLSQRAAP
jgi:hypothetical protein